MEIKRSYDHRKFGHIGDATLVVPDGVWKLNGHALSPDSIEYLATFALQAFQDAYAGADTREIAISEFTKKVTRVIEGTIGVRGNAGVKTDDASKLARSLAKDDIKRALAAATGKNKVADWVETEHGQTYFKNGTNGPVWNESAVESFIERNHETRNYRAEAERQIADSQAVAAKITL